MEKKTTSGFPPGWDFRNNPNRGSNRNREGDRDKDLRNKAISELQGYLQGSLPGEPVEYDDLGLPIIPDVPTELEAEQEEPAQYFEEEPPMTQQPPPPPRQQQRQAPQQEYYEPVRQAGVVAKAQHPVVLKMLERFGIHQTKKHILDLYPNDDGDKISYTMTLVPEELSMWCLNEARNKQVTEGDMSSVSWYNHLLACSSVVAIDDVPVWQLFDVQPQPYELQKMGDDPTKMTVRLRKECARKLGHMLWSETQPISDKLFEFYDSKINNKIKTSNDKDLEGTSRHVCPMDGCSTVEFLKATEDAQGNITPYYCKVHGIELVRAADLITEDNYPLG